MSPRSQRLPIGPCTLRRHVDRHRIGHCQSAASAPRHREAQGSRTCSRPIPLPKQAASVCPGARRGWQPQESSRRLRPALGRDRRHHPAKGELHIRRLVRALSAFRHRADAAIFREARCRWRSCSARLRRAWFPFPKGIWDASAILPARARRPSRYPAARSSPSPPAQGGRPVPRYGRRRRAHA
jgi:hypothetical protein